MPDEFDFEAAMAAKGLGPETDEVVDEATEVPAEEVQTAEDQPRDPETGKFVAKDEKILGKFDSYDALAQAYQEAEKRLGQQGSEVGDLRRQVEELRQSVSTPRATVDTGTLEALDQLAETNPVQAANWVLTNAPDRSDLYERVMETWFQNDARGASRYENWLMVQNMQREMESKITPQLAPMQEQVQNQHFEAAWRNVAAKHPDLATYQEAMAEAAKDAPELAEALLKGDVAAKERHIENLLRMARGMKADTVVAQAVEQARQSATETAAEKVAATVASASSASRGGGEGDRIAEWKKAAFLTPEPTSIWTQSQ